MGLGWDELKSSLEAEVGETECQQLDNCVIGGIPAHLHEERTHACKTARGYYQRCKERAYALDHAKVSRS
jgi:hypothetical protein